MNKVVGLALKKEKYDKHVNQTLIDKAKAAGFSLKVLDPSIPLDQQGPLDAVLQKLHRPEWEAQLDEYARAHPDVKVFDHPAATLPIRNRGTMLTMLEGDGWVFEDPSPVAEQPQQYNLRVPTSITLREGTSFPAAAQQLQKAGLHYPLLAKPVWADGREGSHALAVIGTEAGLQQLVEGRAADGFRLPVLVQQYVDHGGCLFKVYVLGRTAVMVKRNSLHLPLVTTSGCLKGQLDAAVRSWLGTGQPTRSTGAPTACTLLADARSPLPQAGAARDPEPTQTPSPLPSDDSKLPLDLELITRVSAYPRCKSWGKWDLAPKGHGVISPPMWLIQELAQRLRRHLGLNLFNFDVIAPLPQQAEAPIRSGKQENGSAAEPGVYYVIDINYFPGYEKLPGYEDLMVQFLSSIWEDEAAQ